MENLHIILINIRMSALLIKKINHSFLFTPRRKKDKRRKERKEELKKERRTKIKEGSSKQAQVLGSFTNQFYEVLGSLTPPYTYNLKTGKQQEKLSITLDEVIMLLEEKLEKDESKNIID